MKIFNTLTRRKDEFVPIEEGKVRSMSADRLYIIISISAMHVR